ERCFCQSIGAPRRRFVDMLASCGLMGLGRQSRLSPPPCGEGQGRGTGAGYSGWIESAGGSWYPLPNPSPQGGGAEVVRDAYPFGLNQVDTAASTSAASFSGAILPSIMSMISACTTEEAVGVCQRKPTSVR